MVDLSKFKRKALIALSAVLTGTIGYSLSAYLSSEQQAVLHEKIESSKEEIEKNSQTIEHQYKIIDTQSEVIKENFSRIDRMNTRRGNLVKAIADKYPSFVSLPSEKLNFSNTDIESLEDVLARSFSNNNTRKKNICKLSVVREDTHQNSVAACTFLTNGWILASYHQINFKDQDVFEQNRYFRLVTSQGYKISAQEAKKDLQVVAISPLYDLALLHLKRSFPYLSPTCIDRDGSKSSKDFSYVRFRYESSGGNFFLSLISPQKNTTQIRITEEKIPEVKHSSQITLSDNGLLNYKNSIFHADLTYGDSGSPIYNQHGCVAGVFIMVVTEKDKTPVKFYTPFVRRFIQQFAGTLAKK